MVTVGIDPHKHLCYVAAVDASGRRIGSSTTIRARAWEVETVRSWARTHFGDQEILWAVEDGQGLARRLADTLLLAGARVVWVPPRTMAAHRRLHAPTGAKSDVIDAVAVARAAVAEPDLARHRIDVRVRQLRLLVDTRADLVRRRTAVINRVTAWAHTWLEHTPSDLTRPRGRTHPQTVLATAGRLDHAVHHVFTEALEEIATLSTRIGALETEIRHMVAPLAPHLLAITGISHLSAAILISEIGDITRFPSAAKLARYTGCAPIPVSSSGRTRHRLFRGGNRRLNTVIHTAALTQKRFHPGAAALLDRHEPHKGKKGAYRVLKRHLVDVIYQAMIADHAHWEQPTTEHTLAA